MKESVRVRIRRLYIEEGLYFITAVTRNRHLIFAADKEIAQLRQTMRSVKEIHPFTMPAYVFLPDHLHLLLRVGESTDISQIIQSIKCNYTLDYKKAHGENSRLTLWQPGFWDQAIRDERDYLNHLDYIHYNPVKHGYVTRPEDYPHSSYLE